MRVTVGFVFALGALILVLALNWRHFGSMPRGEVLRMAGLWVAIILGLALAVRLLGLA